MPQASESLRTLMRQWFHTTDDGPPTRFLDARGWTCHKGMWTKPSPSYQPSDYEVACLRYLRDEWDHDWHKPLFFTLDPDLEW
jgi:hypothetical protein